MRRHPDRARLLAPLALTAAFTLTLAACGAGAPAAPPASQGVVLDRPAPAHIALVNQNERAVSLASLRGKVVVMAPFLTLCQDECPLITAAFITMQRDVKAAGLASKVAFVEVTVDPGRDTPPRLAAYSAEFGADWQLWTGSPSNLAAFWKHFGVSYQVVPEEQPAHKDWYTGQPLTYDVDHSDGYILLDSTGHERFVDASAPDVPNLSKKLAALLDPGGVNDLHHPLPTSWTVGDALQALSWVLGTQLPTSG
jgi:protein SCO1/2